VSRQVISMREHQPFELDRNVVEDVVRQATHPHEAHVISWQVRELTGGREVVSNIYQVTIAARLHDCQALADLIFILKIVRKTPDRLSPEHWNYWLREAAAYQSGALAALPAGLAAPKCYGVTEHDDAVWIWLDYIPSDHAATWSEADIGQVVFDLGRFNGAYLVHARLPVDSWVSRGWLRHYVNSYAAYIEQLPDLQKHPLVGRAVQPHLLPHVLRLVDEREWLLQLLDGLPQVFCHFDAWRGNLFVVPIPNNDTRLVAVDWAFAGIGAVGQELAPILFTQRRVPTVAELAIQHYVAGLRAVGWQGDERIIQLSSAVAAALVYGVAMVGMFIGNLLDERAHADLAAGFGVAVEQLPPRATAWVEFGLHYADLARAAATGI
jgi:hypothetical protein